MKKTYQYIALAAIALGLAACSQEDDFTPQGNQKGAPLAISSAGVADLTTRAVITTIEGTDYLAGGSMGVFVKSENTNTRYKGDNLKWDYDGSWKPASTTVLYEADGTKQTIGAYYPYTEELTDGTCAIELPETFGSDYEDYDYLYADYVTVSDNPMNIQMNHLLSMVTVNVAIKESAIDNSDAVKSVSLFNVPRTAVWAVPTATLSDYGSGDKMVLYANDTDSDETVDNYVGYALPNKASTLGLRVEMESGRIFTAKAPISGGMTDGVHYKIGLNLGKDKVEVRTVTVAPWGERGAIEGGVANEYIPSIDGTEYTSLSDLQAAVKTKLSQEGATSVTIGSYLSEGMHAAIISAISEVKTEGAVTNGYLLAGTVTYTVHATFADAFAVWTDYTTLTLLDDATNLTDDVEITATGAILDLNGHEIQCNDHSIEKRNQGTLTIRDSKGGGYINGQVNCVSTLGICPTLYLENGTLKTVMANGNFIMTGGCVNNPDGSAINSRGKMNRIMISGGEVTGGKFWAFSCDESEIIITGSAKINAGSYGLFSNSHGTTTITGGTFNANPSEWVNLNAYTVTENSDGTWSVTVKE